jgi:hypothetical protein
MMVFNYYDSADNLTVEEHIEHIPMLEYEHLVRTGFHGYGADFEDEVETVTRRITEVPVSYEAVISYDGVPILRYSADVGPSYASYLDEMTEGCDDIECNDDDFKEWLWISTGDDGGWFLDYALFGSEIWYLNEDKPSCTDKEIVEHDSKWFEVRVLPREA